MKTQIIRGNLKYKNNSILDFVNSHSKGNFFQSYQAFEFFKSVDNYEPILIVAEDKDKIVGCLLSVFIKEGNGIKGYFSRRCIIWGRPLVKKNDSKILNEILNELNSITKRKAIYTEFRNLFYNNYLKETFETNGFKFEDHLNYIVSVSNIEENKRLLSESKRRQINKSLKNGAEIIEADNLKQVYEFYKILSELYLTKVNKPLPSFSFFKNFFAQGNLGKFFLIRFDSKIIGGMMSPIFKETIYEWYICGLDKQYKYVYPSALATWAPIEYAAKNGLKYFNFLGAGKPNEDYGVREFKSKFGGKLVNHGRFLRINKKVLYNMGKIGFKTYQRLFA